MDVIASPPPNTRVQRTRLRSPLTRHPLGGVAVSLVLALALQSGCAHSSTGLPDTAFAPSEAAVRFMAASLGDQRSKAPVLFLEVGGGDPPRAFVRSLSDIGVQPFSEARIDWGPTPEAVVTDRVNGQFGMILQIHSWNIVSDHEVILDVFYGMKRSLLTVTLVADRWNVSNEKVLELIIASCGRPMPSSSAA